MNQEAIGQHKRLAMGENILEGESKVKGEPKPKKLHEHKKSQPKGEHKHNK